MILHGVRSVWNQMDKWDHMFTMPPHTLAVKMAEWCETPGLLISCCKSVFKSHKQCWKLFRCQIPYDLKLLGHAVVYF